LCAAGQHGLRHTLCVGAQSVEAKANQRMHASAWYPRIRGIGSAAGAIISSCRVIHGFRCGRRSVTRAWRAGCDIIYGYPGWIRQSINGGLNTWWPRRSGAENQKSWSGPGDGYRVTERHHQTHNFRNWRVRLCTRRLGGFRWWSASKIVKGIPHARKRAGELFSLTWAGLSLPRPSATGLESP
jgi:hypothetical protein